MARGHAPGGPDSEGPRGLRSKGSPSRGMATSWQAAASMPPCGSGLPRLSKKPIAAAKTRKDSQ